MKRLIFDKFKKWSESEDRFPILLYGARQVGKTYIVNEFANTCYPNKFVYINFFKEIELRDSLQDITSPQKILNIIKNKFKLPIDDTWLYIFDEVQEVPSLKTALKIFVDEGLKHRIICTGSYLGNTLNLKDKSFPVGKVEIWTLYPMNFEEYLIACNRQEFIDMIKESIVNLKPIPKFEHNLIMELLHRFMFIGGMPEIVQADIDNKGDNYILDLKERIIEGYKRDIAKYLGSASERSKCLSVYENIPEFFSKKYNKYILSKLDKTARYLSYESAIKNLLMSNIVYKINNIKKPTSPLITSQNESEFKLYFNNSGFISYYFGMNQTMMDSKNNIYPNQKGALAENFVISEFIQTKGCKNLFFYAFKGNEPEQLNKDYVFNRSNTSYEIDLILEDNETKLVPIEIKYGKKYTKASLNQIMHAKNVSYGVIFSSNNISWDDQKRIIELPLYCAGFLDLSLNRIKLLDNK